MHRKSSGNDVPLFGRRPSLSARVEWERMWVRRLGLEDVEWDPKLHCEHCIAKRVARAAVMEELASRSGSWPKLRLSGGWAKHPPRAGGRKRRSKGRCRRLLLKLVRLARLEHEDS
jgi:hypothetical protein